CFFFFFFSSRRRHTRFSRDWSSDVCSSDLVNGALNLSVLDGWWGEGYDKTNGWAITPRDTELDVEFRNREEARDLLDLLEREVIPLYYNRASQGYSRDWVTRSKASMKTITPRFNAQRMVMDYVRNYYQDRKGVV